MRCLVVPEELDDDTRASIRYDEGLGFKMTKTWIDEGRLRWCWLDHGDAVGVTVCLVCEDALALDRAFRSRGPTEFKDQEA